MSNADVVRAVSEAIKQGDAMAIMGMVSPRIRWTAHAADPGNVPWFGVFEGKRGLLDLFASFTRVTFTDVVHKALVADGDTVITWVHVAFDTPAGRHAESDEVLVWQLSGGKVQSVDVLFDTAAVAAAFA